MTILDIDQDYFFSPPVAGTLSDLNVDDPLLHQTLANTVEGVLSAFAGALTNKTPIVTCTHHDELAHSLLKFDITNVTLYHLDAHSDMTPGTPSQLNMANWVSFIADRITEVWWIMGPRMGRETPCPAIDQPIVTVCPIDSLPQTPLNIDLISWTYSPGWCRQDLDLLGEFKRRIL